MVPKIFVFWVWKIMFASAPVTHSHVADIHLSPIVLNNENPQNAHQSDAGVHLVSSACGQSFQVLKTLKMATPQTQGSITGTDYPHHGRLLPKKRNISGLALAKERGFRYSCSGPP
jgi:hypothetical protein